MCPTSKAQAFNNVSGNCRRWEEGNQPWNAGSNLCLESRASQRHRETLQVLARTGKFYFALGGHGMSSVGHPTALSREISVMVHSRQEILSEPAHRSLALCLAFVSCLAFGGLLYMWWDIILEENVLNLSWSLTHSWTFWLGLLPTLQEGHCLADQLFRIGSTESGERKRERKKYKRSGRQSLEGESSGVLGKNKIRAAAAHEQNGWERKQECVKNGCGFLCPLWCLKNINHA